MTPQKKLLRRGAGALLLLACLSGCASAPTVITAREQSGLQAIPKNALGIQLKNRMPTMAVSKHERGFALQAVQISDDERKAGAERGRVLVKALAQSMLRNLGGNLAPYVTGSEQRRYDLVLEVERVSMDTDGSVEVVVSAELLAHGASRALWTREVYHSRSRFGSDADLGEALAGAILKELKFSFLLG